METAAVDPSFDDLESLMTGAQPTPQMPNDPGTSDSPAPVQAEAAPVEEKPVEEQPPASEAAAEPEEEATPEPEVEPAKKPGWQDKRMSAMAAKRREAEQNERIARREAEDARARAERLERELEAIRKGESAAPPASAPGNPPARPATTTGFDEPKPMLKEFTQPGGKFFTEGEDYDDAVQRHSDASIDWRDKKRAFEDVQAANERIVQQQGQVFKQDNQAAMDAHPDFEDSKAFVRTHSSEALQLSISHLPRFSEEKAAWPEVVVYLADHPDELASLEAMHSENPIAAVAKLGQIMASIAPAGKARAAAPRHVEPSATPKRAPTPPKTVGGNAAPPPIDLNDDGLSMDAFAKELGKFIRV